MLLPDFRILITGAAGGLGSAMAAACVREGAVCVVTDCNENGLRKQAEKLGANAIPILCDLTDGPALNRLVCEAVEHAGGIDGLVNNAALLLNKPLLDTTSEDWASVTGANLTAVFSLSQAVCRQMLVQSPPGGSIVNVASVHAHATTGGSAAYGAAKSGLLSLTRAIAVEFGNRNIRANTISPGLCDTPMWHRALAAAKNPKECEADWLQNIPIGRVIAPEEVAELVVYLLSRKASAITGSDFVIDGGLLASLLTLPGRE